MAARPELPTAIVRYPASPTHPIRVGFEAVDIEVWSIEMVGWIDGRYWASHRLCNRQP